jgi:hypothetical protein
MSLGWQHMILQRLVDHIMMSGLEVWVLAPRKRVRSAVLGVEELSKALA